MACEAPAMARSLTRGCCPWCLTDEEKTAARIDQEINKILLEQKKQERGELKLLLLGECGRPRGPDRVTAGRAQPQQAGSLARSLADPFSGWEEQGVKVEPASGCREVARAAAGAAPRVCHGKGMG